MQMKNRAASIPHLTYYSLGAFNMVPFLVQRLFAFASILILCMSVFPVFLKIRQLSGDILTEPMTKPVPRLTATMVGVATKKVEALSLRMMSTQGGEAV